MRAPPHPVVQRPGRHPPHLLVKPDHALHGLGSDSALEVVLDEDGKISRVDDLVDVELGEPAPESDRQVLLAHVEGRVHAGEQAEVFMPHHWLVVPGFETFRQRKCRRGF